MVVTRNVFHLKFGKAKEAIAALKDGIDAQRRAGVEGSQRLMTDVSGRFYTVVLEVTAASVGDMEALSAKAMALKEWQAAYQKFIPLVESGYRETFTLVP